jgi:hypothetical protein
LSDYQSRHWTIDHPNDTKDFGRLPQHARASVAAGRPACNVNPRSWWSRRTVRAPIVHALAADQFLVHRTIPESEVYLAAPGQRVRA